MGGLGPGIGGAEWLVLGVIALLVVGPERLPALLRELGKWVAKARGMASEFRASFEDMARQSELDELRKEVQALRSNNPVDLGPDADATFRDIKSEFQRPLFDPAGPDGDVSGIDPADPVMTPAPTEWPVDTGAVVETTGPVPPKPVKKRVAKPRAAGAATAARARSSTGAVTASKTAAPGKAKGSRSTVRGKVTDL